MSEPGMDIQQLRDLVVGPALEIIGLGGTAAEELMIGTILQESGGGHWLHQLGSGPAIGICQSEARWSSLTVSMFDKAALTSENLD